MELTECGAAGVTVAELEELHNVRDIAREIALCEAVNARDEAGVPHDVFMASIEP